MNPAVWEWDCLGSFVEPMMTKRHLLVRHSLRVRHPDPAQSVIPLQRRQTLTFSEIVGEFQGFSPELDLVFLELDFVDVAHGHDLRLSIP